MKFKYPNSKKLYLAIEISQLLHQHDCTYKEAKEILKLITDEINQQQEELEYNNNDIVKQMNHVDPYC